MPFGWTFSFVDPTNTVVLSFDDELLRTQLTTVNIHAAQNDADKEENLGAFNIMSTGKEL